MSAMASQITSLTIVYSIFYSSADQRKHQSSASLVFVRGIHRWPVNSSHKGPVTQKMFPFDDVIMLLILFRIISRVPQFSQYLRSNIEEYGFIWIHQELQYYHNKTVCIWPLARSRYQGQGQVITSHSFVGYNYLSLFLMPASGAPVYYGIYWKRS